MQPGLNGFPGRSRYQFEPSPATSAAVGARFLGRALPDGGTSSTRGLPSTTSTVVGRYCSLVLSQGGSYCARSITMGAYFAASRRSGDPWAPAGGASAGTAAATSIATRQPLAGVTRRTYQPARAARRPPGRRQRAVIVTCSQFSATESSGSAMTRS